MAIENLEVLFPYDVKDIDVDLNDSDEITQYVLPKI